MLRIAAIVKSYPMIWERDKDMIKLSSTVLDLDWNSQFPSEQDALSILAAQSQQWKNPTDPFQLNKASLEETLNSLIQEIEAVWGDKLRYEPKVEILPQKEYLPRINELEKVDIRRLGYGEPINFPPTMYLSSSSGILIMPETNLVRVPKHPSSSATGSIDFDIISLDWDRPFFEEVLCEELCHALFRQLRGEWKGGYSSSMKPIGSEASIRIKSINEAIALFTEEVIAKNGRNQWGLYVASDKVRAIWTDELGINDYLGIDALSSGKKLAQIAMVDDIKAEGYGMQVSFDSCVYVSFDPEHPNHKIKEQTFL